MIGNIERSADAFMWREEVSRALSSLNIICFDPNKEHFINQPAEGPEDRRKLNIARSEGNWSFVSDYMKSVIARDLRYVDLSEFIIGNIEPSMPTFGTIHELVIASLQNKPILLHIKDKKEFPLWLAGLVNMDLVFEQWEDLINYVKGIDSGEIFADPKYWKILIEEYR
jgi:hypothetical protein